MDQPVTKDAGPVTATICNERGLHARAAAKFVRTAEQFDAAVTVSKDGMSVVGTSIMGLMMLGAAKGSQIRLEAKGRAAEAVLKALQALVADGFDEDK